MCFAETVDLPTILQWYINIQKRCNYLMNKHQLRNKNTNNALCISCGLSSKITMIDERYDKDSIAKWINRNYETKIKRN